MSIGDMLVNQLREDADQGVCVDRDKYNDQRIINALGFKCPECDIEPLRACKPLNEYQQNISGEWIHTQREMI